VLAALIAQRDFRLGKPRKHDGTFAALGQSDGLSDYRVGFRLPSTGTGESPGDPYKQGPPKPGHSDVYEIHPQQSLSPAPGIGLGAAAPRAPDSETSTADQIADDVKTIPDKVKDAAKEWAVAKLPDPLPGVDGLGGQAESFIEVRITGGIEQVSGLCRDKGCQAAHDGKRQAILPAGELPKC